MNIWTSAKRIPSRLWVHRRAVLKRAMIYLIILAIAAPFLFVYRIEIYSTILLRHDQDYTTYGDDGIPWTHYGYQAGVYVGVHTTAREVANAAIVYYDQMEDGNYTVAPYFNNTISWLVDHHSPVNVPTENGTMEIVHWYSDFAIWDLPEGWYQSMGDAKAIHALSLAYSLYGNSSILNICEKAIRSFEIPSLLEGNAYILEDGTTWYPEYLVPKELDSSYRPKLILNGFLIALDHLHRANLVLNSTRLERIFDLGVVSAAANLYRYDYKGVWTLYHLAYPIKLASLNYHRIHVLYTGYLYDYSNVTVFKTYHDLWETYRNKPLITIDELFGPDYIYYGMVMVALIIVPLFILDMLQLSFRKRKRAGS